MYLGRKRAALNRNPSFVYRYRLYDFVNTRSLHNLYGYSSKVPTPGVGIVIPNTNRDKNVAAVGAPVV